jgi:hypothetical protein
MSNEGAYYRGVVVGILYTVAFFVLLSILRVLGGW